MRSLLLLSATLAFASFGCSADGATTPPVDLGNATFAYSSTCTSGCSIRRPALDGSHVKVFAKAVASRHLAGARVTPSDLASISGSSPLCADGSDCPLEIDIHTLRAGDGTLEVVDDLGNVVDRTPFHVHDGARIALAVEDGETGKALEPTGADYQVAKGSTFVLSSTVFDADGAELAWTDYALSLGYGDASVVDHYFGSVDGPEPSAAPKLVAVGAGDAAVSVRAEDAVATVTFHVSP